MAKQRQEEHAAAARALRLKTLLAKLRSRRQKKTKQCLEERAAAAQAWRLKSMETLAGYHRDITTLQNLIIFPDDHNEATTEGAVALPVTTPLSVRRPSALSTRSAH